MTPDDESTTAVTLRLIKAEWITAERRRILEEISDMLPGANRHNYRFPDYNAGWGDALDAVAAKVADR